MLDTSSDWYGKEEGRCRRLPWRPSQKHLAEYSEPYLTPGNPPVWHDTTTDTDTDMANPRNRAGLFMWLLKEGMHHNITISFRYHALL